MGFPALKVNDTWVLDKTDSGQITSLCDSTRIHVVFLHNNTECNNRKAIKGLHTVRRIYKLGSRAPGVIYSYLQNPERLNFKWIVLLDKICFWAKLNRMCLVACFMWYYYIVTNIKENFFESWVLYTNMTTTQHKRWLAVYVTFNLTSMLNVIWMYMDVNFK